MHTGATSRKWMLVLANLDEFGVRLRDVGPPAVYFPISLLHTTRPPAAIVTQSLASGTCFENEAGGVTAARPIAG